MKPHSTFVGPDGIVELDTLGAVHANVALIVLPADTKDHQPVRFGHTFQDLRLFVRLVVKNEGHHGFRPFLERLAKLRLTRVPFTETLHEMIDSCMNIVGLGHSSDPGGSD